MNTTASTSSSTHAMPLSMHGVVKRYGDHTAVNGLNLQVSPGEIVALLGPNGAGKSTTIAIVLGFETIDAGSVHVWGVDVAAQPQQARSHVS